MVCMIRVNFNFILKPLGVLGLQLMADPSIVAVDQSVTLVVTKVCICYSTVKIFLKLIIL